MHFRSWPVPPFHGTRIIGVRMVALCHIAERGLTESLMAGVDPQRLLSIVYNEYQLVAHQEFAIDIEACLACGGKLRVIAWIEGSTVSTNVLKHILATAQQTPSGRVCRRTLRRSHTSGFEAHGRSTRGSAQPDAGKSSILRLARRLPHPLSPLAVATCVLAVLSQPSFTCPVFV
jgi:hypothetical protein